MPDPNLLELPNASPPPVPGAESPPRPTIKLPTRAPSTATSRPMKMWNAIWDDWYTKTGKVRKNKIFLIKEFFFE